MKGAGRLVPLGAAGDGIAQGGASWCARGRLHVRHGMPFGLSPGAFKMPGIQPEELYERTVMRRYWCSPAHAVHTFVTPGTAALS